MKRIYLASPHIGDEEMKYIQQAFDTNWVAPLGPNVEGFENELKEYVNVKNATALSSGTSAIHLVLKVLGVKEGDVVFCSSLTFSASVNPVIYEKAIPVFIDSDYKTWNMSPKALQNAFDDAVKNNKLPKAVIVVNLYGQSADYDEILKICNKYNVPVIEDAAESLGATYKDKQTGTIGEIGIFSFNGNKIITTSGGGMMVSNNEEYTKKALFLATQAREPERHYEHKEIGYNYRMSNICAGIGRGQLKVLDEKISKKKYIYESYKEAFEDIDDIDMTVVSPGVPLDLPFILKIKSKNIEIIGEVELAYRLSKNPIFIGITGTNGKTTTTSLVGEIFKKANRDTYIVGNIGNPVIDTVGVANENSVLVTELSSFQLESIATFKPHVSAILNFTEDHLNRHHTMEAYMEAKARIFENQDSKDFCVLNYDDEDVRSLSDNVKAKKIFFSRKKSLECGIYLDEDKNIIVNINEKITLLNRDELSLPGDHNLENCMAAAAIAYVSNIDIDTIREVLKTFAGVEHRQEFVRNLNGVMFVNDSKATNPDSSIKAVQSYNRPIVLIAGGMDKQSSFDEFLDAAKENVYALVLLGETAQKIKECAQNKGFDNIIVVKDMKEAVNASYQIAKDGDVVLLSPACASWDMYKSFEVRGIDFKDNVNNLK